MEKQKNIPRLRFREFEGEWEKKKLVEIGEIVTGSTPPTANHSYYNGNFLFVSPVDIQDNRYVTNTITTLTQEGFLKGRKISVGATMFVCIGSTIGKVAQAKQECITNQQINSILPFKNNSDFVFSLLEYHSGKIKLLSAVQAVPIINKTTFSNYYLSIPLLPEQQKIASFFTAIDRKISQLKRKLTLLEQYKKGVMQKIFSQEIRFRDDNGQEFPKWEKKRFTDVYSFKNNNSFSRENLNYEKGVVKNIHYGDIHTKLSTWFDITKEKIPYINEDLPIERISVDNYCKEGDLIFADASEDLTDVGKSIELVNLNNEKVLSGLHTILARPDLSKMTIGFGGYLMKSLALREQIIKEAQGSKVSSISAKKLSGIGLNIPIQKEQTKIANFLSAIDDKINHTQKQIEKAEFWKKGLMQQMFV